MSATARDRRADVIVVGAGHVGLLLALALERLGVRPTIIADQPVEAILGAPFAGRAIALMYGSKRVFEALGFWAALATLAEPVRAVVLEDRGTGAGLVYEAAEIVDHPFAYGIETRALRRVLLRLVIERPGIEVVAPVRLSRLERTGDQIAARLDDGRLLKATLIVGADGRGSTVRTCAGLDGSVRQCHQSALTFALRHELPHGGRVREFLRPAGPLALLPIGPNLSSVTWIEAESVARHLLSGPADGLVAALSEQIGGVLGAFQITGEPAGHPLSVHHARRFVAPRIALVGDAAHGIHPIHAQGFNLAVRDVATLAEVLVDAARYGRDLGDAEILMRYDRLRRADARVVAGITEGLNGLFSNDLGPAKMLRRVGLSALGRISPVKHLAMRLGMGLSGELPRLARGEIPQARSSGPALPS
jgi:2-octaprenyl-6-methoxyphenol hydroxylase